nr:MAG TPA: hypothetical protein [Caudoviricetes sp.]
MPNGSRLSCLGKSALWHLPYSSPFMVYFTHSLPAADNVSRKKIWARGLY